MNLATVLTSPIPGEALQKQARIALSNALDAHRKGQQVYGSLKNLGEVIGTEYGKRVIFELIQDAREAHASGDDGEIPIQLVATSETDGRLLVANRDRGFRKRDASAIMNLATSGKERGDGIGNKGLGFRSVEAITADVHIQVEKIGFRSDRGFAASSQARGKVSTLLSDSDSTSRLALFNDGG